MNRKNLENKMKKHSKKIAFHINQLGYGGAERVILQLADGFAKKGYHVLIITTYKKDKEYAVNSNIQRIILEKRKQRYHFFFKNINRIIALRKVIKSEKPDYIISFLPESNFRILFSGLGLSIKKITTVRNNPSKELCGLKGKIIYYTMRFLSDGCVFQTPEQKAYFPVSFQNKGIVIPNPIKEVFLNTNYKNNIRGDIVTLGRLSEQKNHKLLIQSYCKIADKFPNINLRIYGIGTLKQELQEIILKKNLGNRIFLEGLTDSPAKILANASVFVLSSNYEGMPNALMEALAVGVPCISTDCPSGGSRMLIEQGKNGFLVEMGDVEHMAEKIELLLKNQKVRNKIIKGAKKSSRQYAIDTIIEKWDSYLGQV